MMAAYIYLDAQGYQEDLVNQALQDVLSVTLVQKPEKDRKRHALFKFFCLYVFFLMDFEYTM